MTVIFARPLAMLAIGAAIVAGPLAAAATAQPTRAPGQPVVSRVTAGTYRADPNHTIITYTVDHLGFSPYSGTFGNIEGTMQLNPARIADTKVDMTVPLSGLVNASSKLTQHMNTADFFDSARFPAIRFVSTRVVRLSATTARMDGNVTIRGVTRPISLNVRFHGAGKGMAMGDKPSRETVGFSATAMIKRSDFGVSYALPMLGDMVKLDIAAAFEKQ